MIPDFYPKWTCQRNAIKAVHVSNSRKTIHTHTHTPSKKAPSQALQTEWLLPWLLPNSFSWACQGGCCLSSPAELFVLRSTVTLLRLLHAGRHPCPRETPKWRERHPKHWGIQRLSSAHLCEVPLVSFAPQSCSSLVEMLGENSIGKSRSCWMKTVLECNDSYPYLRHLLYCWRKHVAGSNHMTIQVILPRYN